MADSPVFDHVCSALEAQTGLDRLESRGTVRLALKDAGLDAASVDVEQMTAVLQHLMAAELQKRGIDEPEKAVRTIESELARTTFDVRPDRAAAAAATIGRFGG